MTKAAGAGTWYLCEEIVNGEVKWINHRKAYQSASVMTVDSERK
jgi:hypothetical protein